MQLSPCRCLIAETFPRTVVRHLRDRFSRLFPLFGGLSTPNLIGMWRTQWSSLVQDELVLHIISSWGFCFFVYSLFLSILNLGLCLSLLYLFYILVYSSVVSAVSLLFWSFLTSSHPVLYFSVSIFVSLSFSLSSSLSCLCLGLSLFMSLFYCTWNLRWPNNKPNLREINLCLWFSSSSPGPGDHFPSPCPCPSWDNPVGAPSRDTTLRRTAKGALVERVKHILHIYHSKRNKCTCRIMVNTLHRVLKMCLDPASNDSCRLLV